METRLICFECGQESGSHKISCGSRSRVNSLQWLLDDLHHVPQDVLDYVAHKIYVESLERKLNFDGYQKESEKTWEK